MSDRPVMIGMRRHETAGYWTGVVIRAVMQNATRLCIIAACGRYIGWW